MTNWTRERERRVAEMKGREKENECTCEERVLEEEGEAGRHDDGVSDMIRHSAGFTDARRSRGQL